MKKLISLILCFLLLILSLCSAWADEEYEFVFRSGVKWGMSASEIMEALGEELENASSKFDEFDLHSV